MTARDVFGQLDECATTPPFNFPSLGTFTSVSVRLSAYRSASDWAVVMETFVFNDHGQEGHLACYDMVFCFGSALAQPPGIARPRLYPTADGPSGPLFDSRYEIYISSAATDMKIRDTVVPITTRAEAYAGAGITLSEPPRVVGYELLELIAPKCRELLFATDSEIFPLIGGAMPLLLRLDEWRHPVDRLKETPSSLGSFRSIAEAIAANDASLYRPSEPPNTHWSNWPETRWF